MFLTGERKFDTETHTEERWPHEDGGGNWFMKAQAKEASRHQKLDRGREHIFLRVFIGDVTP